MLAIQKMRTATSVFLAATVALFATFCSASVLPRCVPRTYTFAGRPGAPVPGSDDGAWALTATRNRDGKRDVAALFDSARPPKHEQDLGTPGECVTNGPGVGVGGRKGARGENCKPLGMLLVAHEGDIDSLRKCVCKTTYCDECQPDDAAGGADFVFQFKKRVRVQSFTTVDLDGAEALRMILPSGTERVIKGLGDNSVQKVPVGMMMEVGDTLTLRCTGSCGIASLAAEVCETPDFPGVTPGPPTTYDPQESESPEPPGPCIPEEAPINFQATKLGLPVRGGDEYELTTRRFGPNARDDVSAVFDTYRPTGGDFDLGAPNQKCPSRGPGIGAGGEPGKKGENCKKLGHVLIAHEGDIDALRAACSRCGICTGCEPDDTVYGSEFAFKFLKDTTLHELAVLDVDEVPQSIIVTMEDGTKIERAGYGDNGLSIIPLGDKKLSAGETMTIRCVGSCGIVHIRRSYCVPKPECIPRLQTFNKYKTGDPVRKGRDWTLETIRYSFKPSLDASAVFNTSRVTGGDTDLGSPNAKCSPSGPGIGAGGEPGSPGENCVSAGQVLIAHTGSMKDLRDACSKCPRGAYSCPGCEPNDHAGGASFEFKFTKDVQLKSITLMDLDDDPRSAFVRTPADTQYFRGYGDNSVQKVSLNGRIVKNGESMYVRCASSCAIVSFEYYPCIPAAGN